jgi:hypothetical protein
MYGAFDSHPTIVVASSTNVAFHSEEYMEGIKAAPFILSALLIGSCLEYKSKVPEQQQIKEQHQDAQTKSKYPFTPVKEMLSRNCTPCHVPGGKMYGTMPFDDAEVVKSHSEGILHRIDKAEDRKLMEDWLSEPTN